MDSDWMIREWRKKQEERRKKFNSVARAKITLQPCVKESVSKKVTGFELLKTLEEKK
jgi:hypothetical protein